MPTSPTLTDNVVRKSPMVAIVLCWIAVLLDGFDLVVLGVVLPSMMEDPQLQLTAAEGTQISTAGLFGMMLGALAIGRITDIIGRRWVIIVSVFAFSVLTMFLGVVEQVWLLILLRFLAGLGLGGCMPTVLSMVTEYRGRTKAGSSATLTMTGYHVGAVLTSLMGIIMLADFGWHSLFIVGAVVGILITPSMIWKLPESPPLPTAAAVSAAGAIPSWSAARCTAPRAWTAAEKPTISTATSTPAVPSR